MRENASLLDKFLFRYPWPLIESSMKEQIKFEQYGELPERLRIEHEEKRLEESLKNYLDKYPNDRLAFLKCMVSL